MQNYPNPFNPVTKIKFALPVDAKVSLTVYDLLGRKVIILLNNDTMQAGVHSVDFNGAKLSSGVYFYRIEAGEFVGVKRMLLLK